MYPTGMFVVPARAGSKRLPGKNLLEIDGQSLIERAVRQGLRTVGSGILTTDIPNPERYAPLMGGKLVLLNRHPDLCQDGTTALPMLKDAVGNYCVKMRERPDFVVLLQTTSPCRRDRDVRDVVDQFLYAGVDVAYKGIYDEDLGELPGPDGSVYVYDTRFLMRTDTIDLRVNAVRKSVYHSAQSSSIDVDTWNDFDRAVQEITGRSSVYERELDSELL